MAPCQVESAAALMATTRMHALKEAQGQSTTTNRELR
jgi:hypothetical protein